MLAPATDKQAPEGANPPVQNANRRLLSIKYLMLRSWTAGSALLAGFIQTFVFARVLSPEQFSLFIVVGALGVSMWLFDLGLSKILFVRIRKHVLADENAGAAAGQATAVALFYAVLVILASLGCFALMTMRPSVTTWQATEFALFLFFNAINLSWFVLRNISVATDEYIAFESLDAGRRLVFILLLLALLAGLPFSVFVIAINIGWIVVFTVMIPRLIRRGVLAPRLPGAVRHLKTFFTENWKAAMQTGTHAAGELYIHHVLYLVVPLVFGLGAPTIIADTALKIFLGLLTLCSAACDLLVPRQTSAYASKDARTLTRATATAAALCALPAAAIAALLALDATGLFALLLGPSATMPPEITPILLVLLVGAIAKAPPNFLLQHTGYFREVALLSGFNIAAMTLAIGAGIAAGFDISGLLTIYAGVILIGSALYMIVAIRGPIRDAGHAGPALAPT